MARNKGQKGKDGGNGKVKGQGATQNQKPNPKPKLPLTPEHEGHVRPAEALKDFKIPKKAQGTNSEASAKEGVPESEVIPDHLVRLWLSQRRCLVCGDSKHFKRNCPHRPVDAQLKENEKKASKSKAKAKDKKAKHTGSKETVTADEAEGGGGEATTTTGGERKRPHSGSPTGVTPDSKKPATEPQGDVEVSEKSTADGKTAKNSKPASARFSFATEEPEENTLTLVIVNKDGENVRRSVFDKLQAEVNKRLLAKMKAGEESLPDIIGWWYANAFSTVRVKELNDTLEINEACEALGLMTVEKSEWQETRGPSKVISGFLRGVVATMSEDDIMDIVSDQKDTRGIRGRLELFGFRRTEEGGVLRLKADALTLEDLEKKANWTLNFLASGRVLFQPVNKGMSVDNRPKAEDLATQIKNLEERLLADRARLATLQRRKEEEEQSEKASTVNTLGMSHLGVGEDDEMDTENKNAQ